MSSSMDLSFCHLNTNSLTRLKCLDVRSCRYGRLRPERHVGFVRPQKNVMRNLLDDCNMSLNISRITSMNAIVRDDPNPPQHGDDCNGVTMKDPSRFFEVMAPVDSVQPDQMSASSLAYLGDVLFELFVRSRYVWPSRKMSDLQNKVVSVVRADAQALLLKKFVDNFPLTNAEQAVLARGRNANLTARKKGKSSNESGAGVVEYQDSTALEALLGYAYIIDKDRFSDMIHLIKLELDKLNCDE